MYAYDVKSYQVPYTPALEPMGDMFYDIAAKAEDGPTPSTEEFRLMMRALLANRFRLTVHQEMRQLPVYALNIGRKGVRMREGIAGGDAVPHFAANGRNYELKMARATIEDIVRAIENSYVDRPVIDRTGLTGAYQVALTYTPNTSVNRKSPDVEDISIFEAVQKLGLRLVAEKAMVSVLVVDHLEKPTTN
jgi:uncharacterized protein (TIGR03435 family)